MALDPYAYLVSDPWHGTGAVTAGWPPHKAGDYALLIIEHQDAADISLSDAQGFQAVANSPADGGTNITSLTLYWHRATSSAMGSPTIADPGDHIYARIITFRNMSDDDLVILNATAKTATTQNSSSTVTAPSVTTTVPGCLIVNVFATLSDTAGSGIVTQNFIDYFNSNLIELHEVSDGRTAIGLGGGFAVCAGIKVAAGATGTTTATLTDASSNPTNTTTLVTFTLAMVPGDAPVDLIPPVITNFTVAANGQVNPTTVIGFDVTDETSVSVVVVLASFPNGAVEVVHDGDNFRGRYTTADNTRLAITGGYRYKCLRRGGWPGDPTFEFIAVDTGGNIGAIT